MLYIHVFEISNFNLKPTVSFLATCHFPIFSTMSLSCISEILWSNGDTTTNSELAYWYLKRWDSLIRNNQKCPHIAVNPRTFSISLTLCSFTMIALCEKEHEPVVIETPSLPQEAQGQGICTTNERRVFFLLKASKIHYLLQRGMFEMK